MFYFFSFEVFYKTVINTIFYIENLLTKKVNHLFKKEKL